MEKSKRTAVLDIQQEAVLRQQQRRQRRCSLSGEEIRQVSLMTPKGIELYLEVEKIQRENESVSCAIQKDSGDDPDVTNGIFVYAKVTKKREKGVTLDGGGRE